MNLRLQLKLIKTTRTNLECTKSKYLHASFLCYVLNFNNIYSFFSTKVFDTVDNMSVSFLCSLLRAAYYRVRFALYVSPRSCGTYSMKACKLRNASTLTSTISEGDCKQTFFGQNILHHLYSQKSVKEYTHY